MHLWSLFLALFLSVMHSMAAADPFHMRLAQSKPAPSCEPPKLALDEEFVVLGAGGDSGRRLDYQIDQSGSQATQIDVIVNSDAKPIVLMLGAYGPTIWNIRWTRNSYIRAIVASGYHRQVVAGTPKDMPVLITTFENKGPCGFFYYDSERNDKINPIARRLFGQPVALFYPAKDGHVTIGAAVTDTSQLLTARDNSPESYFDKSAPLAGKAGLEDALKRGVLRQATQQDVDAWLAADAAATASRDEPPVAGGKPARMRIALNEAYVVLKPLRYPAGLYGGNSVTFFVPRGVPAPTGTPGHSRVYDFNELESRRQALQAAEPDNEPSFNAEDFKKLSAAEIEARLEGVHPATYYFYALELFRSDRKDEAVFWFYVGQLRYRFHLLANPNLDPSQDGAAFASLTVTFGSEINAYAGGNPQEWARQIERVLDWDMQHANAFTSKTEHAAVYQQNRAGLQELRTYVLDNAADIEAERRRNGLDTRK